MFGADENANKQKPNPLSDITMLTSHKMTSEQLT